MSTPIDVLPVLPRSHVIAIGPAAKMPVRIAASEISEENKRPDSDTPEFGEHGIGSEKPEADKPLESKDAYEASAPF